MIRVFFVIRWSADTPHPCSLDRRRVIMTIQGKARAGPEPFRMVIMPVHVKAVPNPRSSGTVCSDGRHPPGLGKDSGGLSAESLSGDYARVPAHLSWLLCLRERSPRRRRDPA